MPGAAYAYGSMTTVLLRSAAVDDREVWTAVIERQLTAVSSEQPKRRNGMVVLAAIVLEYRQEDSQGAGRSMPTITAIVQRFRAWLDSLFSESETTRLAEKTRQELDEIDRRNVEVIERLRKQ